MTDKANMGLDERGPLNHGEEGPGGTIRGIVLGILICLPFWGLVLAIAMWAYSSG